jgi:hypothetical protein
MFVVYHTPRAGRHSAFAVARRAKAVTKPNLTDCVWLVPGTARLTD